MPVRTKQLAAGLTSSTSAVDVYECPADHVTIVKDVWLRNGASGARDCYWGATVGGTFLARLFAAVAADASVVDSPRFFVLAAGDKLTVQKPGSGSLLYLFSGAELEL